MGLLLQIKQLSKFSGPEDPVFATQVGTPVDAHNELRRKIKPVIKAQGLPNLSWHDLRHTCNTWAETVLTVDERKKIFGWSQDTMASRYTHPEMERIRERLAQAMEGLDWKLDRKKETIQ